ncbi:MAG TPA: long-chain fatty acid--CoA ligase [Actinomycetota bacterium]|nr:long-chain fatty acid--CoA ligase [Actinomycetota bacterium]
MDIAGLLRATAERLPDKDALVAGDPHATDPKVTYAQLDAAADAVAGILQKKGLAAGDRVALGMHNIPEFAMAYFGILRAGGIVVPLNAMLSEPETRKILDDSGARFVFTAPPFAEIVAAAAGGTSVEETFSTEDWGRLTGTHATHPTAVSIDPEDVAVIAYTSGTTAEPKGAMLTHGNLIANLEQQMAIPGAHVEQNDVVFLALPLFHIFGLNVSLGLTVMSGATGVLIDRFEPVPTLRAIRDHRVTILLGAPTMYSAWVSVPGADQYDLSSVRLAISGAAPLGPDVLRDFRDLFGVAIYEGYGMTETSPTLVSNRMAETPRPGSIGKALPNVEFKLVDDNGNTVEMGDPGEIVVRGPNVFKGYWRRPEETAHAFLAGGWFRTGDVGVLDEDGYLYLVDRKRDLIIVSGFNVYPAEVEAALLQNDKIAEAAVVGVTHPYTGEAVKAFVVLEDGVTATEQELIAESHSRLARFKAPTSIEIVEELPHLPTGKVLKRALRI